MKELFIKYFKDASSYQSIDPTCFNLTEYTETWLITHKKQLSILNVVWQSEQLVCENCGDLEVKEQGDWCNKCLDIDEEAN